MKEEKKYNHTGGMPENPNAALDLTLFDYTNLVGQPFIDYCKLVEGLPQREMFDFMVMRVEAVRKVRYKGIKDSPVDVVGIRIVDMKPIHPGTRITTKQVFEMNGHIRIDDDVAEIIGGHFQVGDPREIKQYYLLKK